MARGKNTATATAPLTTEAPQSTQSRTLSSAILVTVTAVCWERYLAIVTVVAQAIWEIAAPIKNVAVISNPTFRADSVETETQDCDPRQDARGRRYQHHNQRGNDIHCLGCSVAPSGSRNSKRDNIVAACLQKHGMPLNKHDLLGFSYRQHGWALVGLLVEGWELTEQAKRPQQEPPATRERSQYVICKGDGALAIVVAVVGHAARVASKVDRCYFSDAVVYSVAVRFLEPLGMVRHKVRKPSHWAAIHTDTVNITRSHLHTRVQSQEQIVTTEQSWEVPAHDHRTFDLAERGHKWNHRLIRHCVCPMWTWKSRLEIGKLRD